VAWSGSGKAAQLCLCRTSGSRGFEPDAGAQVPRAPKVFPSDFSFEALYAGPIQQNKATSNARETPKLG
jgi:hypothetical protein